MSNKQRRWAVYGIGMICLAFMVVMSFTTHAVAVTAVIMLALMVAMLGMPK